MRDKFDKLTMEYSISAREYFMLLKLAILHIDGKFLKTNYEVTQYETSDEIYKCACNLLLVLQK